MTISRLRLDAPARRVTGFQATVILTWVPNDDDLDGNLLARNLASEACWDSPPNGLDRVQSAAYQKDRARTKAFLEWERDYHYDRMMEKFLRSGTGPVSGMHTSMPSLYHPPPLITASGKRPSKWKQMTEDANDSLPPPRCFTTGNRPCLHRLLRFPVSPLRPPPPPSTYSFTCGEVLRDPDYILHEFRLFYQPRIDTAIHTPYHTLSLRELYNVHPNRLLFLKQSGAAARPLDSNGPN